MMLEFYKDKTILIFGSCGFVSSFIIQALLDSKFKKIIGVDSSEDAIFWATKKYASDPRISFFTGDVTDLKALESSIHEVDIAFFLAACKHVGLSETSPIRAIQVNAYCMPEVMTFCRQRGCSVFVYASSDKAVNPTNVMGATKMLGEKLTLAASDLMKTSAVRFGNILGSPGSIIPVLIQSADSGGLFELRGRSVTRYVMVAREAARLILSSAKLSRGGEIFVMKMPVTSMTDLVEAFKRVVSEDFSIKQVGLQIGEKMFEELISDTELDCAKEMDHFIVIDKNGFHSLPSAEPNALLASFKAPMMRMGELDLLIRQAIKDIKEN